MNRSIIHASVLALALPSFACGGSEADEQETDDNGIDTLGDGEEGGGAAARCSDDRLGPPMLRRLTRNELEATLRVVFPEIDSAWSGVALGPDPVAESGFSNDAEALVVGNQTAGDLLATAEEVAELLVADGTLVSVLPCAASETTVGCATEFIEDRGAALFRRPLSEEEISQYAEHFQSIVERSDFNTALRWTAVAMIQSPQAVYRSELGQSQGDRSVLDPYELASALSYNFSGLPPDDALVARALAGDLDDPEVRVEEARRLLATEAGHQVLRRFFREWTGYGQVVATVRGDDPEFEAVRGAMEQETERFIEAVLYEDSGDVRDLLTAPFSVLNPELTSFYGYGSAPDGFGRVSRPEQWGVGLLAQGSLLASNAHTEASSPTLRGVMVYERLLCNPRLTPPADIPAIVPSNPGVQTTRQRYEDAHAAEPGCNTCHQFFDPIGFAFEHFDNVGRYRADENGLPIDASGVLVVDPAEEPVSFDGALQLAQLAAETPEVTDCVSGLAAGYVFGGAGGEVCVAETARTALQDGEVGLLEFVAQLAAAPHFAERQNP